MIDDGRDTITRKRRRKGGKGVGKGGERNKNYINWKQHAAAIKRQETFEDSRKERIKQKEPFESFFQDYEEGMVNVFFKRLNEYKHPFSDIDMKENRNYPCDDEIDYIARVMKIKTIETDIKYNQPFQRTFQLNENWKHVIKDIRQFYTKIFSQYSYTIGDMTYTTRAISRANAYLLFYVKALIHKSKELEIKINDGREAALKFLSSLDTTLEEVVEFRNSQLRFKNMEKLWIDIKRYLNRPAFLAIISLYLCHTEDDSYNRPGYFPINSFREMYNMPILALISDYEEHFSYGKIVYTNEEIYKATFDFQECAQWNVPICSYDIACNVYFQIEYALVLKENACIKLFSGTWYKIMKRIQDAIFSGKDDGYSSTIKAIQTVFSSMISSHTKEEIMKMIEVL